MGKFISAFCPSPPGREEMFPQCIWPPVLSTVGAIGPPAALDLVVPSKWMLMWWGYRQTWVSSRPVQADGSQRFCVYAYDVGSRHPDACRDLSVVLCIMFLLYQPRQEENEKRRKKQVTSKPADRQVGQCLPVKAPGCYAL
jgi:hypothetical protein